MIDSPSLVPILAALAAFFVCHIGIAFAMRGFRLGMVEMGEAIIADVNVSDASREEINRLLDTCMSFKVSMLIPIGALSAAADSILGGPRETTELDDDDRFHDLLGRYFFSVLAANLLFAPIAILSIIIFALVDLVFNRSGKMDFVEQPALRASHAISY